MSAVQTKEKKPEKSNKLVSAIALVLCLLFGAMLICNLTIIIKGSLHPERPPAVLGVTPMVVLSGSMSGDAEDHIEVGDLIFVGPVEDPATLETGDVIAFMDGTVVVTHRIIDIQYTEDGEPLFYTKGDANNAADRLPVTAENLVGIYQSRIPKVGDFALFLKEPLGMVLFIGVPLLAFILYDIWRRRKFDKKETERTAELEAELERLRKLAGETADKGE